MTVSRSAQPGDDRRQQTAGPTAMAKPQRIDFHQRDVPRPIEVSDKSFAAAYDDSTEYPRSPKGGISFRIAAASGEGRRKNTRPPGGSVDIAKSDRKRHREQVARETFTAMRSCRS